MFLCIYVAPVAFFLCPTQGRFAYVFLFCSEQRRSKQKNNEIYAIQRSSSSGGLFLLLLHKLIEKYGFFTNWTQIKVHKVIHFNFFFWKLNFNKRPLQHAQYELNLPNLFFSKVRRAMADLIWQFFGYRFYRTLLFDKQILECRKMFRKFTLFVK